MTATPRFCLSVGSDDKHDTQTDQHYYFDDPAAALAAWDLLECYARPEVTATLEDVRPEPPAPEGMSRTAILRHREPSWLWPSVRSRLRADITRPQPPALPGRP